MDVRGIKGIGVSKSVFHKKKYINLIFVIIDVLFVDARNILDNCRSRGLLSHE